MIILPIATMLVFANLGYKLKKNIILWGLMGLGIWTGPPLLVLFAGRFITNPAFMLACWPLSLATGIIGCIAIIGWVASKNNIVFFKRAG